MVLGATQEKAFFHAQWGMRCFQCCCVPQGAVRAARIALQACGSAGFVKVTHPSQQKFATCVSQWHLKIQFCFLLLFCKFCLKDQKGSNLPSFSCTSGKLRKEIHRNLFSLKKCKNVIFLLPKYLSRSLLHYVIFYQLFHFCFLGTVKYKFIPATVPLPIHTPHLNIRCFCIVQLPAKSFFLISCSDKQKAFLSLLLPQFRSTLNTFFYL